MINNINLLPWRQSLRAKHQRKIKYLLAVVFVIAILLVNLMKNRIQVDICDQRERNQLLQNEIILLNQNNKLRIYFKHKKRAFMEKIAIMDELYKRRAVPIHFFNNLMDIVPADLVLSQIKRDLDQITLIGVVQSTDSVSRLISNVSAQSWIIDSSLPEIKKGVQRFDHEIKLSFTLNYRQINGANSFDRPVGLGLERVLKNKT